MIGATSSFAAQTGPETSGSYCAFVDNTVSSNCTGADVTVAPPYAWSPARPLVARRARDELRRRAHHRCAVLRVLLADPYDQMANGRRSEEREGQSDEPRPVRDGPEATEELESVLSLHANAEARVDQHQRFVERMTRAIGRPRSLYVILGVVAAWALLNTWGPRVHLPSFDPPPFFWLQGLVSLAALLTTTVVLTTQRRQGRLAEHRSFLDLQVNLLAEKKVAKLISLVEELRRDLPNVRDRRDPEAEAMKRAVDPNAIISVIESTLEGSPAPDDDEATPEGPSGEPPPRSSSSGRER
ncbi:MAG: DUF1003 domain-containing protein [Myxococcales bacterium]|nr:DUF1003 domain-containing protein [Myxococcales bacterium]